MALPKTTNCRIAGHFTDRRRAMSEQCSVRPKTGCCCRGLSTRVAATNHDDIEV